MITIHLDGNQAKRLIALIGEDYDLQDIAEQIRDEIKWEHETRFCNTEDCTAYRMGICPYAFADKSDCPKYKQNKPV